jgi:hypothetical protein
LMRRTSARYKRSGPNSYSYNREHCAAPSAPAYEELSSLSFGNLLSRLRTENCVSHYSIRTEQSYEQWVRRFSSFSITSSPLH